MTFKRGEMRLVVNNVPAWVCPSCGEVYVGEQVAVWLLREAEAISAMGELDVVVEYDRTT